MYWLLKKGCKCVWMQFCTQSAKKAVMCPFGDCSKPKQRSPRDLVMLSQQDLETLQSVLDQHLVRGSHYLQQWGCEWGHTFHYSTDMLMERHKSHTNCVAFTAHVRMYVRTYVHCMRWMVRQWWRFEPLTFLQRVPPKAVSCRGCQQTHSAQTGWADSCAVTCQEGGGRWGWRQWRVQH